MSHLPLVSIFIICYNQENFIVDTIESCLNQTYSNIEICVSDDCSTDQTFTILQKYKRQYPQKIKIKQMDRNMGQYSLGFNLNSVLEMVTGKYVAQLDGDDIMSIDRIEKQVSFLEQNNDYVGVSGWVEAFDDNIKQSLGNIHSGLNVSDRSPKALISGGNSIPPCLMFKNGLGVQGSVSLKIMIDWLLFIEISMLGRIGHINEYLGRYRIHGNNSIHKNLEDDHFETLSIIERKYGKKYKKEILFNRVNWYINKSIGNVLEYNIVYAFKNLLTATKLSILLSIKILSKAIYNFMARKFIC